jgi:hypothetical protein
VHVSCFSALQKELFVCLLFLSHQRTINQAKYKLSKRVFGLAQRADVSKALS